MSANPAWMRSIASRSSRRDAFAQLALALAQTVSHLVERAAPVALVPLELLL